MPGGKDRSDSSAAFTLALPAPSRSVIGCARWPRTSEWGSLRSRDHPSPQRLPRTLLPRGLVNGPPARISEEEPAYTPVRFEACTAAPEGSRVMSKHIGSSLESLFDETGEREQFERITLKKVIAERVRARMKQRGVNQTQLARAMHTNRLQVQRLLDASHTSLTLSTLARVTSLL